MTTTASIYWRSSAQRYRLAGSTCPRCNQIAFPPRERCVGCVQEERLLSQSLKKQEKLIMSPQIEFTKRRPVTTECVTECATDDATECVTQIKPLTTKRLKQMSQQVAPQQIVGQLFEHMMEALPPGIEKPDLTQAAFHSLVKELAHNQDRLRALLIECFDYPDADARETAFNVCIKVFFFSTLIRQMTTLVAGPEQKMPQTRQTGREDQFNLDLGIYLVYLFDEIIDRVVLNRNEMGSTDRVRTVLEKLVSCADQQIFESPNLYFKQLFDASLLCASEDDARITHNRRSLAHYLAPLRETLWNQEIPATYFDWLIHAMSDVITEEHRAQLTYEQFIANPACTATYSSYQTLPQSFLLQSNFDDKMSDAAELTANAILQNQGLLLVTITALMSCDYTALSKFPAFIQSHYADVVKLFSLVRLTDDLIDRQLDREAGVVNIFLAPEVIKIHFLAQLGYRSDDDDYHQLRKILFSPDHFQTQEIYAQLKEMRTRLWDQLRASCADQGELTIANVMNFVVQAAFVNGTIDDRQIALVAKALQSGKLA